jgi:NTP pyrophosphatase (non-canonical NTP hydrolase)
MAQFTIKMPQELLDLLNGQVIEVAALQKTGELPVYPVFNRNLMKNMNTPAEELHHAATGISGEAGEILDVSKKVWVYNKPLDVAHMVEELGDLRFYYQSMLALFGLTDEQIVASNMVKLRKRYADGKYSDAQANARADKNPAAEGLSAGGTTGTAQPAPRKFMGAPAPEPTPAQKAAAARQDAVDPDTIGERQ